MATPFLGITLLVAFIGGIKIVMEYQRGIKFTLGRCSGVMDPGLNYVIPFIQSWRRVDTRVKTIDIPAQEVITKDNIPARIDAVVYFKVIDPKKAVLNITDYNYAISKYGQTSLRNVSGEATLDELLSNREQIANKLREIVDIATDPWGLDVVALELQDIELPADLKRIMARQAEAEREKRATIIKAEGEALAADNLSKAANMLSAAPGAMHLRTMDTLGDVASDQSNTVNFILPVETLGALEGNKNKR
ncbi:MAG: slipin family protein [Candidatus Diapherotrites archaeon]|nr:slipin family protein [Candidatus Diapherotrites archaeon]